MIGPGGKIIQGIQADTGATIVIEEIDNRGVIDVFADNKDSIEAALAKIAEIIAEPEVGEIYKGKVKGVVSFGAFIEIMPGRKVCCTSQNGTGEGLKKLKTKSM